MSKKKLVSVAIIVMMVAILSYSTLAWFYAEDKVVNDFQISDSLSSFDIDVWEVVPGDTEGTTKEVGKGTKSEADSTATFEDVVPEEPYLKTVHVTNTSGNKLADQYIMVKVTFTNYSALKELGEDNAAFDCTEMLIGGAFSKTSNADCVWWYDTTATQEDSVNDTITYTFYLNDVLADTDDVVLFEEVMLPGSMDIDDVEDLANGGFQIKVVAYAVQTANIVDADNSKNICEWAKDAFAEYAANPNP